MNQKGFANIMLIVLVVVLAGVLGYVVLIKKSSTPATKELSFKSCIVSLYQDNRSQYDFWKNKFATLHPEFRSIYDAGSYCELNDGTKLISFSHFTTSDPKSAGQTIALFDASNNLIRETKGLYCQGIGDVPAPFLDSINGNTLLASCRVTDKSGELTVKKEKFEIDISTFKFMATVPTPTPKDGILDWKTYRNELMGIEVKYPPKYYVVKNFGNPGSDTFTSVTNLGKESDRSLWGKEVGGAPAHIQLIYHINRRNLSIADLAKEWANSAGTTSSCKKSAIVGESALRCSLYVEGESGLYSDMIFLKHSGTTYSFAANSPASNDIVHSDLLEILATLKFLQ